MDKKETYEILGRISAFKIVITNVFSELDKQIKLLQQANIRLIGEKELLLKGIKEAQVRIKELETEKSHAP